MAELISAPVGAVRLHRDIVVIGGSSGSRDPLLRILRDLDAGLDAAVFVVQHRMANARSPVDALGAHSRLPVVLAEDRAPIRPGFVYIAPGGRHLLLNADSMRVLHGPRENLSRPSIDVLFRSAAVNFGSRVIGVLLSGDLHDGAAGLDAIRRCGGFSMVQDPADAANGDLPRNALQTAPNKSLPSAEIGALLNQLVPEPAATDHRVPRELALEARAAAVAMSDPSELSDLGEPSHFTCPECQGPLWRMHGAPEHYRCDVGHAFTFDAFERGQARSLERALWVAYRVLAERARLLEHMEQGSRDRGMRGVADDYQMRMHELHGHARSILNALAAIEAPPGTAIQEEEPA